jgi:hypothetical protein
MLTNAKLTKIPLPGGSGAVPSGALQFQDDWPGLFIRGDEAVNVGLHINLLLEALKEKPSEDPRIWTAVPLLEEIAEMIERHVRVKSTPSDKGPRA